MCDCWYNTVGCKWFVKNIVMLSQQILVCAVYESDCIWKEITLVPGTYGIQYNTRFCWACQEGGGEKVV